MLNGFEVASTGSILEEYESVVVAKINAEIATGYLKRRVDAVKRSRRTLD